MTKKIDWLQKHSKASMEISAIILEIRSIAKSFSITGNVHINISLMEIAWDIEKANKVMNDAIGESLQESIKRSENNSKTILEATLAGLKMGKETP